MAAKSLCCDADDGHRVPVDADRRTKGRCITFHPTLPILIAHNGDRAAASPNAGHLIVFRTDGRAGSHSDAQHVEVVPGDEHPGDPLRRVPDADVQRLCPKRNQAIDGGGVIPQVGVRGVRHAVLKARAPSRNQREGGRILDGQRAQENGVDNAEGGRVGANAQRERHPGRNETARIAREPPQRVSEIHRGRF
jgi:hypothetical protein